MFVIIDMSDDRKRIFEKYRRHDIEIKRFDVKGCAPFFCLKAHRRFYDAEEIKKTVGRYGLAVFAHDIPIPHELSDLEFKPYTLPLKMLICSAAAYYGSLGEKQRRECVTVIDKRAKCCDVIWTLANNVRYVRVITDKAEKYEDACRKIYEKCGAAVSVTDKLASAYGSDMIISVDNSEVKDFDCGKIMVYKKTAEQKNAYSFSSCRTVYPGFDCERAGVDSYLLLCALYETCGYRPEGIPLFDGFDAAASVMKINA